jgi:hypothetical protein
MLRIVTDLQLDLGYKPYQSWLMLLEPTLLDGFCSRFLLVLSSLLLLQAS